MYTISPFDPVYKPHTRAKALELLKHYYPNDKSLKRKSYKELYAICISVQLKQRTFTNAAQATKSYGKVQ